MINSRNLTDLDPVARTACQAHIDLCKAAGIDLLITSTYRDSESQGALWAIGRTDFPQGPRTRIVTDAKPGASWHEFRCAYDVVPLIMGKPDWNSRDKSGALSPTWAKVVALGIQAGAEAAANWTSFREDAHFTVKSPGVNTTADAKALFETHGTIFLA